ARVRGRRNRNGGQGQSAGRGKGSQGFLHDLPSWVVGGDRPSTERGFAAPSTPTCYWNRGDRNPGNLSEICYRRSPGVQGLKKRPMSPRTKAEPGAFSPRGFEWFRLTPSGP